MIRNSSDTLPGQSRNAKVNAVDHLVSAASAGLAADPIIVRCRAPKGNAYAVVLVTEAGLIRWRIPP